VAETETRSPEETEAVAARIAADLRPGDVVLVKASRAAGLEKVAEALLDEGAGT
jgi:UDP-N-acetylmuramoyl-tripeptide--D-alanyl-D-alanine ligase